MGLEAKCRVEYSPKTGEKQSGEGKALCETSELLFRGPFKLKIPFKSISKFGAKAGKLTVKFPEGSAVFDLGKDAEKWYLKIRYPRSLMDKLGLKPGLRVNVDGVDDTEFLKQYAARKPEE